MSALYEGTCRQCMRRRPVVSASRMGGGSYNRAQRRYSSSICVECAEHLVENVTPGHHTRAGWDITLLRHALGRVAEATSTSAAPDTAEPQK